MDQKNTPLRLSEKNFFFTYNTKFRLYPINCVNFEAYLINKLSRYFTSKFKN